jgi:hypothetical protein
VGIFSLRLPCVGEATGLLVGQEQD